MKTCMIFPTYPPNYQADGIGDYTRILVENLRQKGQDVYVISSGRYAGKDKQVIKVGGGKWGLKELSRVYKKIRAEKFDLVHMQYTPVTYGFGPTFKLLPLLLKISMPDTQFIVTFHTLVGGMWISKFYAAMISLFSDKIISTNEEITHLYKKWMPFFKNKLSEVPIGANILRTDVDYISARADLERKYGLRKNAVILSNFGFTNPGKGFEDIIEAMSRLKKDEKYYLLMVGALRDEDADYRHKLQGMIRMKGLEQNVIWTGEVEEEKVSALLKASDIYVAPYGEGICTRRGSLMAGIVNALPVISTKPRVKQAYFKDRENIILVDRHDPSGLASAIQELSENKELRDKISRNIVKLGEEFDWSAIADKTIEVYNRAKKRVKVK